MSKAQWTLPVSTRRNYNKLKSVTVGKKKIFSVIYKVDVF